MYNDDYNNNLKNKHKGYLIVGVILIVCFFIFELLKDFFHR